MVRGPPGRGAPARLCCPAGFGDNRAMAERVADPAAFPTFDDDDMAVLEAAGSRRSVQAGDHLFHAGDPSYDLFVVVSGAVEIYADSEQGERELVRHGPRNFAGELSLLT